MAVTTAAVIGAGAAVKGTIDARKNAKEAKKAQERQNETNTAFIERQLDLARDDAASLFPAAEASLLAGQQGALDVFGQVAPQQIGAIQAGSDAARQAILGTGNGPPEYPLDLSFMQQILPSLRAPENRFGAAAEVPGSPVSQLPADNPAPSTAPPAYLQGLTTNEDLFKAAAAGQVPGLSADDQRFWGVHLGNLQSGGHRNALDSTRWVSDPQAALDATMGQPGGFRPGNEQRAARLLEMVLNPVADNSQTYPTAASRFLGGV